LPPFLNLYSVSKLDWFPNLRNVLFRLGCQWKQVKSLLKVISSRSSKSFVFQTLEFEDIIADTDRSFQRGNRIKTSKDTIVILRGFDVVCVLLDPFFHSLDIKNLRLDKIFNVVADTEVFSEALADLKLETFSVLLPYFKENATEAFNGLLCSSRWNLTFLEITGFSDLEAGSIMSSIDISMISRCKKLKKLKLRSCFCADVGFTQLFELFKEGSCCLEESDPSQ
jgi:hypothetical protein